MLAPKQLPSSTYRLQFNPDFTLKQAVELVDYLDELGIGACYASPLWQARAGSQHGYDIVDHGAINAELGGLLQLRRFSRRLCQHGMGLILDVVPNHMAIADVSNKWWADVLENGPSSPYARFFDVDWNPPKPELVNKVLLPLLGDQYGRVLEEQQLRVLYEAGAFWVQYNEVKLPLEPRSYLAILSPVLSTLSARLGEHDDRVLELASTVTALHNLPGHLTTNPARVKERLREKEIIKRRIASLVSSSHEVRLAFTDFLAQLNGQRGDPRSFDALEALLASQAFRLSFWRVAADEINYRRFFDINDLAAIRVEEPSVFSAVHELMFRLLELGLATGLRIDHVDGIADPREYLSRVARRACEARARATGAECDAVYVVVEKILVGEEALRADWPVAGTTGYEFLNLLSGLLVDGRHRRELESIYARYTGQTQSFEDVAYESKQLVLAATLAGELHVLSRRLDRIAAQHRWSRDFTLNSLQQALTEIIACFPVYRTYLEPGSGNDHAAVSEEDQRLIAAAVRRAKRRNPSTSATLFDFIAQVLLLQVPQGLDAAQLGERREFVLRFQQLTAPVMAKGLEDTAFYRYYPLASLNEVGGNPQTFGVSVAEFHRKCRQRLTGFAHGLSATATHDTKRGEDVRARINVLSEIPQQWEDALCRFRVLNQPHRRKLSEREVPALDEEYLLYQTLVGTWPFAGAAGVDSQYVERIQAYMTKAIKEAKVNTSWINPDEEYEQALRDFIAAVLQSSADNRFVDECASFCQPIQAAGVWNSLSQVLLKITAPGVPDFFQGTELWDLSLVDPDNRRPVDYARRRALLAELRAPAEVDRAALCDRLLGRPHSGQLKLHVVSCALRFRRANAELFARGAYEPILAAGERHRQLVAYMRRLPQQCALVVAGRFFAQAHPALPVPVGESYWEGTTLQTPEEPGTAVYREMLSGSVIRAQADGSLAVGQVLAHLPVALLSRQDDHCVTNP